MEDHIYKIIEITGTSNKSSDNAIENAIAKATNSISNMRWFQVTETRGSIDDGKIERWQVTIKVGFTMH